MGGLLEVTKSKVAIASASVLGAALLSTMGLFGGNQFPVEGKVGIAIILIIAVPMGTLTLTNVSRLSS